MLTNEQKEYIAQRFLRWELPANFSPDNGISYEPLLKPNGDKFPGPVGTNLLDYRQARAMVEHIVEGLPGPESPIRALAAAARLPSAPEPFTVRGYEALRDTLLAAFNQSARGKGVERHGRGATFLDQPIMEITRRVGVGGPLFQALKKIEESAGMIDRGEKEAAAFELLGAIIYCAAAHIYLTQPKESK